jgi:hypothetical protein
LEPYLEKKKVDPIELKEKEKEREQVRNRNQSRLY